MRSILIAFCAALLLVHQFSSVWSFTDPQDVFAINALFSSLGSPPLTGWIANGGDPCTENWQGVECVGPNITGLSLPGLNIGGQLGYSLQNFTALITVDLSNNHIGDVIPFQLPPHVQRLFLFGNQFSGSLPYSLALLTFLTDLSLNNNQLSGALPDIFQELKDLVNLDLSFNNFTGSLPPSMSVMSSIVSLHLQNNQLSGSISSLANLNKVTDLNIESNLFNGLVPQKLLGIPNFKYGGNQFSTSASSPPRPSSVVSVPPSKSPRHNRVPDQNSHDFMTKARIVGIAVAGFLTLVAVILIIVFFATRKHNKHETKEKPRKGQEKPRKEQRKPRPEKISYEDVEKELKSVHSPIQISRPLPDLFTGQVNHSAEDENNDMGSVANIKQISIPLPDLFTGQVNHSAEDENNDMGSVANIKPPPIEKHKSSPKVHVEREAKVPVENHLLSHPADSVTFTVASLQQFTDSFAQENLLGEGSLGRVYRAELPDGKLLAIKKLDVSGSILRDDSDFINLVSRVSKLRHSNITELVGYCVEHNQRLLVYQYISNGSLHDALHSGDELSSQFSWVVRVKIALGVARALEYLHEVCQPSLVHRNFKSANILLDDDLNPHLSDCGFGDILSSGSARLVSGQMLASVGYSAPEFAMSGTYTVKSDVYSFGVVMLELLTGRKPMDSTRPRSEQSLVRWAISKLHDIDSLTKMVDPSLNGVYHAKSLSRFADIISLCVQPEPEFRPPMSELVQALVRLVQRSTLSKGRTEEAQRPL